MTDLGSSRRYLAGEVLDRADRTGSLIDQQRMVLIPFELDLAECASDARAATLWCLLRHAPQVATVGARLGWSCSLGWFG